MMNVVIETVGNRVYTMVFSDYFIAPLMVTVGGTNVTLATSSSNLVKVYNAAYAVAKMESGCSGTIDFANLPSRTYINAALLLVKSIGEHD